MYTVSILFSIYVILGYIYIYIRGSSHIIFYIRFTQNRRTLYKILFWFKKGCAPEFFKYLKSSKLYYVQDNNNKNRDNRMDLVVRWCWWWDLYRDLFYEFVLLSLLYDNVKACILDLFSLLGLVYFSI